MQNKHPKSKVRFDSQDVSAMVTNLQRTRTVIGHRVINIYDDQDSTGKNTYLLKMENKEFLLLESGVRFHPTARQRDGSAGNSNMPTPFCAKLRKHLRGLRLEQVVQLGQGDRVVMFQFGVEKQKYAVILELYAKGNLILVDGNTYCILALLRSHTYEARTIPRKRSWSRCKSVTFTQSPMQPTGPVQTRKVLRRVVT
jgi:predicted ribosome quality control (RQC) complex YloA/Tae2 family protein